ncbi:MAG: HAD family hydrolase [Christensenellaceae bacterium]
MKVLYVSDLDGTLITRNERISEYSLGILNALIGRGLLFTYATARSLDSAERAVAGLKHTLPVVIYNGALILDPVSREPLYSVSFGKNDKEALVERLSSFGVSPVVHARESGEDKILWVRGRESEGQSRYLARRSGDKRMAPVETESGLMRGEAYFFACNGNYPLMKKFMTHWREKAFTASFIPRHTARSIGWRYCPGARRKQMPPSS